MNNLKRNKLIVMTTFLTTATSPLTTYAALANGQSAASADSTALKSGDDRATDAVRRDLLKGDKQGFRLEQPMSRAEFAVLVTRVFQLDVTSNAGSSFKDVPASSWASASIELLKSKGWMQGTGNAFLPDAPITREQAAHVLAQALGLEQASGQTATEPNDLQAASSWAKESLKKAVEAGLLSPENGSILPHQPISRKLAGDIAVFASNLLPQTIESFENGRVTLSGIPYETGEAVAALFADPNRTVMIGSKLKGVIRAGKLESIQELRLLVSGRAPGQDEAEFSRNLVLEGNGVVIAGSVRADADFLSVRNMTVKGDFEVAAGLQHDFYGDNVIVEGDTIINGGDENTVVFNNANLGAIEVNKPNVRLEANGNTTTGELTVTNDATIQADNGVKIPKLTVGTGAKNVEIDAPVGTLFVMNQAAKLNVKKPIDKLVLPEGTKVSDVLENFNQIKNLLKEVLVGTTPVHPQRPSAPTSSTPTPSVSKTPLAAALQAAVTAKNASVAGTHPGEYPQSAIDALGAAIAAATAVNTSSTATQADVDAAVTALNTAVTTFQAAVVQAPVVNKSALDTAITTAQNTANAAVVGTEPGQYPQAAKTALLAAITDAELVQADASANQAAVNAAVTALSTAMTTFQEAVVIVIVDKTALDTAITAAQSTAEAAVVGTAPGQYPQAAKTALLAAISDAELVQADVSANQAAVNAAVTALSTAVTAFQEAVVIVDKSALDTAIMTAQSTAGAAVVGTAPGQYPQDAKNALLEAIDSAVLVQSNASDQAAVDAAVTALNTAVTTFQRAVVQAPDVDKTALNTTITTGQERLTYAESWPTSFPQHTRDGLRAALVDAIAARDNPTATQADVDREKEELQAAITILNNSKA